MAAPFILAWELGKASFKGGQMITRGVQRVGGLLLKRGKGASQRPAQRPRNRQGQFLPAGVVSRLAPSQEPSKGLVQSLSTPSPAMSASANSMKA